LISVAVLRVLGVVVRVIVMVVDVDAVAATLVVLACEVFDWIMEATPVTIDAVVTLAVELFGRLVASLVVVIVVVMMPFSMRVRVDKRAGDDVRVVEETAVVDGSCVPRLAMQIWLYDVPAAA